MHEVVGDKRCNSCPERVVFTDEHFVDCDTNPAPIVSATCFRYAREYLCACPSCGRANHFAVKITKEEYDVWLSAQPPKTVTEGKPAEVASIVS